MPLNSPANRLAVSYKVSSFLKEKYVWWRKWTLRCNFGLQGTELWNTLACQSGWGNLFSFITVLKASLRSRAAPACAHAVHRESVFVHVRPAAFVGSAGCHVHFGLLGRLMYSWTCMHACVSVFIHPSALFSCVCAWSMACLQYIKREGEEGKCILSHYASGMKLHLHRLCI